MQTASVGFYKDRNKGAVWIDKGAIRTAFQGKPERVRVETLEHVIVLTDLNRAAFRHNVDDYLNR